MACPPDAVQRAGICLRYEATARAWTRAQEACAEIGGRLAILDVASTVELAAEVAPPNSLYWIGAREGEVEGSWAWVDGRPLVYTAWGANQPNDASSPEDQDCLVVRNARQWFDDDCATPQASMCEWVITR